MHCPSGNATEPIWRVLASSDETSSWTPLKPQHSIPCWLSVQWELRSCRSCQCCQKKGDHLNFVGGSALFGLLGSGRASVLPMGTLTLGLFVIAVDTTFIAGHQSIKNYGIWIDQLDHLLAVLTTSFFPIFTEHPWDKLRANLPYLPFLLNNCVYSFHTDIKLCIFCLYRRTTVLIHEILYLANHLWSFDFLSPPTPLIIPRRLPAILESLIYTKTDAGFLQDASNAVWSLSYISVAFFQVQNWILLHIVLLKCPHVQVAFLKFTSCDNQALVGCILVPAVAVHLRLKSYKLVSHLIRYIAIRYWIFKCLRQL